MDASLGPQVTVGQTTNEPDGDTLQTRHVAQTAREGVIRGHRLVEAAQLLEGLLRPLRVIPEAGLLGSLAEFGAFRVFAGDVKDGLRVRRAAGGGTGFLS